LSNYVSALKEDYQDEIEDFVKFLHNEEEESYQGSW
jgi:hypothetical protein